MEANKRHRSGDASPVITFECETLKSDTEAEDHIKKFMPSLIGRDAVGGSTYSHVPLLLFYLIFLFFYCNMRSPLHQVLVHSFWLEISEIILANMWNLYSSLQQLDWSALIPSYKC